MEGDFGFPLETKEWDPSKVNSLGSAGSKCAKKPAEVIIVEVGLQSQPTLFFINKGIDFQATGQNERCHKYMSLYLAHMMLVCM